MMLLQVVETVSVPSHPIRIQIVSELPFPEAAPEYEIGPLRLDARKMTPKAKIFNHTPKLWKVLLPLNALIRENSTRQNEAVNMTRLANTHRPNLARFCM
jgi:hypothetical protein